MTQSHALKAELSCPFHAGRDERKSAEAAAANVPPRAGSVLRVDDFAIARRVLRSSGTKQAGFMADLIERATRRMATPVLFQEGEVHQKQRAATARYFAPRVVTTRYRELMNQLSDGLMAKLEADGRADLSDMSLDMAVAVAAQIIGLTDSPLARMSYRLNAFFSRGDMSKAGLLKRVGNFLHTQYYFLGFFFLDVKPAIRARRAKPQEDVISHLVAEGYSDREILTECVTYGAAGMVTTREFIVMAAWHLIERPQLRERFVACDEAERIAILEEILRLEPVVGHLYRLALQDITIEEDGRFLRIPAGTVVDMNIRSANTDEAAVGACPYQLVPDRAKHSSKVALGSMSFGDGHHRCPGAAVAMQESAIFLERLLRDPRVRLEKPPTLTWNDLTVGYELRDAIVTVR